MSKLDELRRLREQRVKTVEKSLETEHFSGSCPTCGQRCHCAVCVDTTPSRLEELETWIREKRAKKAAAQKRWRAKKG
jgi:hypothetical protein